MQKSVYFKIVYFGYYYLEHTKKLSYDIHFLKNVETLFMNSFGNKNTKKKYAHQEISETF